MIRTIRCRTCGTWLVHVEGNRISEVNRKAKLLAVDSRQSNAHPLFSDPAKMVEVVNGTQVYEYGMEGDAWRDIVAGVRTEVTCRNCGHKVTVVPD